MVAVAVNHIVRMHLNCDIDDTFACAKDFTK